MNNAHWSKFIFKQAIRSVVALKGGLQHQTDLVELIDGSKWICKVLNENTWLGTITSAQFAYTEHVSAQVSRALECTFSPLNLSDLPQETKARHLIVPYCEGQLITAVTQEQAALLGGLLAQLHELSLPTKEAQLFPRITLPKDSTSPAWLRQLAQRCNTLRNHEKANSVVSHRDIHLQNIIWKSETKPHLIDWESAGLIHPFVELIGLATNCCGLANYSFDEKLFRATLVGYVCKKKLPQPTEPLWNMCFHSWLLWYVYSLKKGWDIGAQATLNAIEVIKTYMPELRRIYAEI
ncbi:phosphotransferase family protein [Legionella hackeliae]|uniref:Aminoglycoside phosphotransferase domain-containing protein n=1 Tax=Legionella hackeliae TaxID=449 RepID=A0A0A8UT12_LEGHA|nr:phosphotransferase [Legionella hackeliae]KTD12475.1 putative aminoglycoside phosphotransferase [Legionella hackeliae]CEK11888.1 protein of unknown function [Legionella hackeliae]STX48655.1 aminoglycoside phosphotransferase [Legionella hackeliae]